MRLKSSEEAARTEYGICTVEPPECGAARGLGTFGRRAGTHGSEYKRSAREAPLGRGRWGSRAEHLAPATFSSYICSPRPSVSARSPREPFTWLGGGWLCPGSGRGRLNAVLTEVPEL